MTTVLCNGSSLRERRRAPSWMHTTCAGAVVSAAVAVTVVQLLVVLPSMERTAARMEALDRKDAELEQRRLKALREQEEALRSIRVKAATIQVILEKAHAKAENR